MEVTTQISRSLRGSRSVSDECWLARFSKRSCDGPIDRCHLIPKQRIRREFHNAEPDVLHTLIWHPAVLVKGCRRHHGDFDAKHLRIRREDLPPACETYAKAFNLEWSLDASYGVRDALQERAPAPVDVGTEASDGPQMG